jgi:large subunit ribosomal protein L31
MRRYGGRYRGGLAALPASLYPTWPFSTAPKRQSAMKADIHPNYTDIKVTCSCGNEFMTRSTLGEDLVIEVCSSCHPFYTGKQKIVDTGGRVDKFRRKYGMS